MPTTCPCIHHDPISCLAVRHKISKQLAAIMGGCACACHFNAGDGSSIEQRAWHPMVLLPAQTHSWKPGPSETK